MSGGAAPHLLSLAGQAAIDALFVEPRRLLAFNYRTFLKADRRRLLCLATSNTHDLRLGQAEAMMTSPRPGQLILPITHGICACQPRVD